MESTHTLTSCLDTASVWTQVTSAWPDRPEQMADGKAEELFDGEEELREALPDAFADGELLAGGDGGMFWAGAGTAGKGGWGMTVSGGRGTGSGGTAEWPDGFFGGTGLGAGRAAGGALGEAGGAAGSVAGRELGPPGW